MTDLGDHIERAERHAMAPQLIQKVSDDDGEDNEAMAEVAAALHVELEEMCMERGLSKHAGQAVCYMIVDNLAEDGDD